MRGEKEGGKSGEERRGVVGEKGERVQRDCICVKEGKKEVEVEEELGDGRWGGIKRKRGVGDVFNEFE